MCSALWGNKFLVSELVVLTRLKYTEAIEVRRLSQARTWQSFLVHVAGRFRQEFAWRLGMRARILGGLTHRLLLSCVITLNIDWALESSDLQPNFTPPKPAWGGLLPQTGSTLSAVLPEKEVRRLGAALLLGRRAYFSHYQ